jgi:hypothetical protein
VQNPALAAILAEARKYNLFVFLTQQYFGQIEKPLQDAIFTNVYNYYVFRVSEEDARALEGNLTIELPKEIMVVEKEKGLKESDVRVRMLTSLNSRECLVRLSSAGQIMPCVKVRTLDAAEPITISETKLRSYKQPTEMPSKFQERTTVTSESKPTIDMNVFDTSPSTIVMHSLEHLKPATPLSDDQPALQVRPISSLAELLASQSSSRNKMVL